MYKLPNDWRLCTLKEISIGKNGIVDGPFGSNLKISDYIDDPINGVPVLTTKNLEGDYSLDKVRFISKEKFEELKRSEVKPGDILMAKIGSIGKTGIYPKNAKTAIIPANLLKFTVSKDVNFQYVYYYLNSFKFQNKIKEISTATAQPAFNVTKFRMLTIPLPPVNIQDQIVNKLNKLCSDLERGTEELIRVEKQLRIYKQAVLKWAFEGKLTDANIKDGELPDGWKRIKLKELVIEKNGLRRGPFGSSIKKEFFVPDGFKVYEQSNAIHNDAFRGNYFIDEKKYAELINFSVNPFDLIVSCSGTMGRIAEIPENALPGVINQALLRIRLDNNVVLNKFFIEYFKTDFFQRNLFVKSQGTAMLNLVGIKDLKEIEITLPPLKEQPKILFELENRISETDKIEELIEDILNNSVFMKQSILKKAFEGELI